jgi:hypothetical protein
MLSKDSSCIPLEHIFLGPCSESHNINPYNYNNSLQLENHISYRYCSNNTFAHKKSEKSNIINHLHAQEELRMLMNLFASILLFYIITAE